MDDIAQEYLTSRQVVDESNSPANRYLQQHEAGVWKTETPEQYKAEEQKAGSKPEGGIEAEIGGLKEPWVDPVSAASGGFGAAGTTAIRSGATVGKALFSATVSAGTAAVADYPLGAATEAVEEKAPGLAMPFSVLAGIVSGSTVESLIEKKVIQSLTKRGVDATTEAVSKGIETVRKQLEDGVEEGTARDVLGSLRKIAASEKGAIDVTGTKKVVDTEDGPVEIDIAKITGNKKAKLVAAASEEDAEQFLMLQVKGQDGKAYNINLSNLETSGDAKRLLQRAATLYKSEITEKTRGVVSNKETQRLADSMGMSMDDLLERRVGQAFNAHEALAARNLLAASSERLVALARKANGPDASGMDKFAFRKHLATHYALQSQVSGMTAEAGRALQAFRIRAKGDKAVSQIVEKYMGDAAQGDITKQAAALISGLTDPAQVNTMVRQLQRAKSSDVLLEAWINGLLSGPQTHAVNMLSNTLFSFWQVPERLLAAGIGKIPGVGGGEIPVGEAKALLFGMFEGVLDGVHAAKRTLLTGEDVDVFSKIEARRPNAISSEGLGLSGPMGRAVDLLSRILPTNVLQAEDNFFKSVGYRGELRARAYREAAGLPKAERAAKMQEILNNPPDDIRLASVDAARYNTFTKPLEGVSKYAQMAAIKHPSLRILIPFIRTPVNLMRTALLERSPFAAMSPKFWGEVKAGGARRDLALARFSLGSMIMGGVTAYSASGMITGYGPRDPQMRSIWMQENQPYSVKINGEWHAFNRLEPIGMMLGVAADIGEILGQVGDVDAEELVGAAMMAVADNVTSKTWLKGVSDVLELMRGYTPGEVTGKGKRYIQNLLGTVVPTGVAQINREMDPTLRQVYSVIDKIKSRIPGYSTDLPPRRNLWGEPIVLQGGLGPDIMSPIYTNTPKNDPVNKEILDNEISISMPSKVVGGVELTPHQYSRYVELAGNAAKYKGVGLHDDLTKMIVGSKYQKASSGPEGMKAVMIRNKVQAYRALAQEQLREEYPDLDLKIEDKTRERALMMR